MTTGKIPDSVMEKATIIMTSSGMRQAVIYADTLYVFEKEDSTTAQNVKVDFFNEQGLYQSTLTAQKGLVRQKQQIFSVWGNVVVANDTSRLETQSLNWDTKRNLITSNDFVRFERNKDVITGYGLEADSRLDNVRILRDVSGKMNNIPQNEGELDSLEKAPVPTLPPPTGESK
jgi:LPS export ABC transporter protein LptC